MSLNEQRQVRMREDGEIGPPPPASTSKQKCHPNRGRYAVTTITTKVKAELGRQYGEAFFQQLNSTIDPPPTQNRQQADENILNNLGFSINQSINQTSIAPISPKKAGSVARQSNQCSTAKSRKQFRNINRPWGVTISMGERPNQRDVSSDIS